MATFWASSVHGRAKNPTVRSTTPAIWNNNDDDDFLTFPDAWKMDVLFSA